MDSLTDSSTRRPDRGANTRASASLQLYADKVKDSGEKSCFSMSFLEANHHPTPPPPCHVTSVMFCAHEVSTSSGAAKYC